MKFSDTFADDIPQGDLIQQEITDLRDIVVMLEGVCKIVLIALVLAFAIMAVSVWQVGR